MKSSNQIPWDYRTYMYYLIAFHSPENTSKRKKFSVKRKPEENMMLLFLLVLLSILSSSCITRKACERRFPPTTYDSVSVVTNTVTTYRDTTIYIHLPGDTVYQSIPVNEGVSELTTPMARSYAWVKDGRLEHRLEGKDTVIKHLMKNIEKRTSISEKKRSIIRGVEIGELRTIDKLQIWFGRFIGILIFLGLTFKLANRRISL